MVSIGSATRFSRARKNKNKNTTPATTKTFPPGAFPEVPETPKIPKTRNIYSTRFFIDDDAFKIKARAVSKDNGLTWEKYDAELEKLEQERLKQEAAKRAEKIEDLVEHEWDAGY